MSDFDYKSLFDNAGVAICLTDNRGNVLLANHTFDGLFTQYNVKNIIDIPEEGYKIPIMKVLETASEGHAGVPYPFSFWTEIGGGSRRKYEAYVSRQPGTDYFIITASDVTRRAEAYDELNRRNRELTCLIKIHQLTSSSINLDDITRTTIVESCKIFDFPVGFILMPDSTKLLRVVSYYSVKAIEEGTICHIEEILNTGRILQWARDKFKTIDVGERAIQEITEGERELLNLFEVSSVVAVPMVVKKEINGFIIFGRKDPVPLVFDQLSVLETLAHQIGISINNAMLFTASEQIKRRIVRQNEGLSLLHKIGLLFLQQTEFSDVLKEISKDIFRTTGFDGLTIIFRQGETINKHHFFDSRDTKDGFDCHGNITPSQFIEVIQETLSGKQMMFFEDINNAKGLNQQLMDSLKKCNIHSLFIAPIRLEGVFNGLFSLYTFDKKVSPSEEDISIFTSIYVLIESVLGNYEYKKMLELRKEELSRLSKKLISAQEEEKKRISKDVHDSLGQLAYSLNLSLSTLSKNPELQSSPIFIKAQEIIQQMQEDIRKISYDLRPPTLEEMGLVSALRWLVEHSQKEGTKIGLGVRLSSRIDFPYSVQVQIFRIAQEAIKNILKHSQATEANIFLYENSDSFYMEISDNGRGFLGDSSQSDGIGLISMKERAESIGGNLKIVSAQNEGTTILLEIKK